MKRISLLILSLLFLSTAFQSDKLMTSGWYQQFFPNLNGSTIQDMTFLDSLTGFAVTTTNSSVQAYILKTTNGGDNWNINYTYVPPSVNSGFMRIMFADSNVGFASTSYVEFFKTTNGGINWINISEPPWGLNDMYVLNKDTVFGVSSSGFGGGVYRSTNGGFNWQTIWTTGGSGNPEKIYMVDKNLGFIENSSYYMKRTTNGGFNWTEQNEFFTSIKFFDSNTGWKVFTGIKKTTNGGLSWFAQITPAYSNNFSNYYTDFAVMNKDTVWMVGAIKFSKPPIYKTTNGGLNWGYEIPDTTVQINLFTFIKFVNSKIGWIGPATPFSILHTKVGGNDTTFFTGIKYIENITPEKYSLGQNYPNPFNPVTNIPFELKEPLHVTLKVFDARGREVNELVNGRWGTGKFIADFDASSLATGIYFYQIIISGESTLQTFSATKKMLMIK